MTSPTPTLTDERLTQANDLYRIAMYGDRGNSTAMMDRIRAILAANEDASAAAAEGLVLRGVEVIPLEGGGFAHRPTELKLPPPSPSVTAAAPEGWKDQLHAAIMNLPCLPENMSAVASQRLAYKIGHRDARHASAELVAASPSVEGVGSEAEDCFCDKQGIGAPGVSCGDCPKRDYKSAAASPAGVQGDGAEQRKPVLSISDVCARCLRDGVIERTADCTLHLPAGRAGAEGGETARPLGCCLAMRVMQSDLYRNLDDAERSDCDELVRLNLDWFKRDSAPPTGGAEGGDGDGAEVLNACRKCGGAMKPGKAMGQTMDCSDEGTCSPAGPGKMVDCMKCMKCRWSVSVGVAPSDGGHQG